MMSRFMLHRSWMPSLVLALFLVFAPAAPASGQAVHAIQSAQDAYSTVDVKRLKDRLDLDEGQIAILDVLFEDYLQQTRAVAKEHQEALKSIFGQHGESEDWQKSMAQAEEQGKKSRESRIRINQQFIADVRNLLTERQQAHWPLFERDRYRSLHLRRGARVGGEGVDLVDLVDRLEFEADVRTALQPILEQYAAAIDPPLREREALSKSLRESLPTSEGADAVVLTIGASPFDPEDEAKVLRQSVAIRDLNDQFLRMLGAQLDAENSRALNEAFKLAAFPRIYRDTRVDHYYQSITKIEDLPSSQRASIDMIYAGFSRDVEALNNSIADYQRRRESSIPKPQEGQVSEDGSLSAVMTVAIQSGDDDGSTISFDNLGRSQVSEQEQRLLEEKKTLVQATAERLFAVLSPDQQEAHPIPPARQDAAGVQFGQITLDDGTLLHSLQLGDQELHMQVLTEPGQDAWIQVDGSTLEIESEGDGDGPEKEDGNEDR